MESAIRIVLCLYIDTILLDSNFKPDAARTNSDDVTLNLKNSLWQVASFAHQNYRKQHAAGPSEAKQIDFSSMESRMERRVATTTAEATTVRASENHVTTTVVSKSDISEENRDPSIEMTTIGPAPMPRRCKLKSLAKPPPNSILVRIDSGDNDLANITTVDIGSKLHYGCREGYEMLGAVKLTTAECKKDLTWSKLAFECKGDKLEIPVLSLFLIFFSIKNSRMNSGHLRSAI